MVQVQLSVRTFSDCGATNFLRVTRKLDTRLISAFNDSLSVCLRSVRLSVLNCFQTLFAVAPVIRLQSYEKMCRIDLTITQILRGGGGHGVQFE